MFKFTKFGSDPEYFVESKETGQIVPFFQTSMDGVTAGFSYLGEYFKTRYYADNCMGEVAVTPFDLNVFTYSDLERYITGLAENITKVADSCGYRAHFFCSYEFSDEQLESKKAREIGCQPFIVSGKGLIKPEPYKDNWRHAGGHIHLSWQYDGSGEVSPELIVKVLDKVLLPYDRQCTKRAELYGMAGAYRLKPYGLEYRSLTNYWLAYPDFLIEGLIKAETVINKVLEKKEK